MACHGAQGTGRRSIFIENQPAVLAGLFISEVCMPRGTETIYPMHYRYEWASRTGCDALPLLANSSKIRSLLSAAAMPRMSVASDLSTLSGIPRITGVTPSIRCDRCQLPVQPSITVLTFL